TSRKSHSEEQGHYTGKSPGIDGFDSVEETLHTASYTQGCGDPGPRANSDETRSLGYNEAQNIAVMRAQSYADANFVRAASHFVGRQAVESNASERQRENGKQTRKTGEQAFLKQTLIDLLHLCLRVEQKEILVDLVQHFAG